MTPSEMARIIVAVAAFGTVAVAWALSGDEAPDADQPIARETPEGLLVTEALDTAYVEPHPRPEPVWRDSFALCRARLSQHGDVNWREVVTR